ncbi:MAG: hypothetical protein KGM91_12600 [Burkholderiales bacterium]|nr:hypothetical protein [Burkholderiales bacterium]
MPGRSVTVRPMTPAERKRAQRQRDRATLFAPGASLDTMPTSGLLDALPGLLGGDRPGTLGEVLRELGRRGGVTVTARPAPLGAGARVRA